MSVPELMATLGLIIGWGFIGAGLFAWARRPDNRVGMLMTATGFAWLLAGLGLSDIPLLFALGSAFGSVYFATAIHMLLSAPSGRLQSRGERRIVSFAYLLTAVVVPLLYLFVDPAGEDFNCPDCPDNVLLVWHSEAIVQAVGLAVNLIGVLLVAFTLVSLVQRWRRASDPERRLYAPLYWSGVVLMVTVIATLVLQSTSKGGEAEGVTVGISLIPLAVMPYLFLASFVRARMFQTGAVGELIARLGEAPRAGKLRDALAEALGDPSLELVYWLPDDERFVDAGGRRFELPDEDSGRAVTKVEREGGCIAAIVYDATLRDARGHVRAVGAAAALALQNERLDAELRAKVGELRSSRERMLRIGLEERRRLERDLHDGAQQRLVSTALNLRIARTKLREEPDAAEALLTGASEELDAALGELRELARGIHPAVLSDRGLDTALETLAARAPVPVELASVPGVRLPEAVELAAYYVVSEALTNVAKYADASHATVGIERDNGRLVVKVADDGVGGADPEEGTGLRGLEDRLAVIEGRLEIDSERGQGTTITARIPCG
ncbi:MAG TPA: sensor histidine kinase [Thermoleophilaceae bacterium]|nr:sensor histidine kinase [Thermoleophilaceae bacterium]